MPGSAAVFYRRGLGAIDPLMVFLACVTGGGMLLLPIVFGHKHKSLLLVLLMLFAVLFHLFIHRPAFYSWATRVIATVNAGTNPFFDRAQRVGGGTEELIGQHVHLSRRGYNQVSANQRRLTTYPPGLVVVYRCLFDLADAVPSVRKLLMKLGMAGFRDELVFAKAVTRANGPALVPAAALWILVSLAAVAAIPLLTYMCARRLASADKAAAAAGLSVMIPAYHLFGNTPNILFPALALGIAWVFIWASQADSRGAFTLAGAVTGIVLFLSFAFLPVLLLLLLFYIGRQVAEGRRVREWGASFVGVGLGGVLVFAVGFLAGYNGLEMFFLAIANNRMFYEDFGRNYFISIPFNLAELLAFSGVVWLLFTVAGAILALIVFCRDGILNRHSVLPVVVTITLCLLLVSGSVRGEVGRNWMCLMPFLPVCAVFFPGWTRRFYVIHGAAALTFTVLMCVLVEATFGFWGAS